LLNDDFGWHEVRDWNLAKFQFIGAEPE
jgi:hypothetical protein